jgi:hypothetical protein
MTDVQHEKFARLMREVETLEEQAMELETSGTNPAHLKLLLEKLAEARSKLTRVSDGCGPGRSN